MQNITSKYGSNNDSGVVTKSKMNKLFEDDELHVPQPSNVEDFPSNLDSYVLIGDDIFSLKMWLLRSFSGAL